MKRLWRFGLCILHSPHMLTWHNLDFVVTTKLSSIYLDECINRSSLYICVYIVKSLIFYQSNLDLDPWTMSIEDHNLANIMHIDIHWLFFPRDHVTWFHWAPYTNTQNSYYSSINPSKVLPMHVWHFSS